MTAEDPWVVIEADATHRIDVGPEEFVVISFHTASQEELLEVTGLASVITSRKALSSHHANMQPHRHT